MLSAADNTVNQKVLATSSINVNMMYIDVVGKQGFRK